MICDAQVHVPDSPHIGRVGGMDGDALLAEMDAAGVDRCVLVPLENPADEMANNAGALACARAHPDRFAVMGVFDFTRRENARLLAGWLGGGMIGLRGSFVRDPNRSLFANGELEWFWTAAEAAGVPLMVLVPEMVPLVAGIAERHPGLRIVVDHLGLTPHVIYDNLAPPVALLQPLARFPNVAVKASALPCHIAESFPFPSLRDPLARVVDSFGPARVFWGSDLTRLPCAYGELVAFFRDELPLPSAEARALVLGGGITEWLGWDGGR